jgi:hypothetical protein
LRVHTWPVGQSTCPGIARGAQAREYSFQAGGVDVTVGCAAHFPAAVGVDSVWNAPVTGVPAHSVAVKQAPDTIMVVAHWVAQVASSYVVISTDEQVIAGDPHEHPHMSAGATRPSIPSKTSFAASGHDGAVDEPR